MQLRVLGPMEIVDDIGTAMPVRGSQARRALAILSVYAPSAAPLGVLNDVLWPDGTPSPNALQATMSKLRKAVAPMAIDTSGAAYTLDLGGGEIDAHRFERLVTAGREAAAAARHDEATVHCDEALSLWRGTPFADIVDCSVGQAPSARLQSLRQAAITTRLECGLSVGRVDSVAAELEALVVTEPLVERWWELMMIARYRQDRQADALQAFQQVRVILADELGLDPGPELRELEAKILRHDDSLGPSSRATFTGTAPRRAEYGRSDNLPRRLSSFIGREGHIRSLLQLLPAWQLVSVVGPGGAGKTSLAVEVARRMVRNGGPVRVVLIELSSVPRGGDVAAAVASAFGIGDADLRNPGRHATVMDRIVDTIGEARTLLVLDNCEHVVEGAAQLAAAILGQCPAVTILATSRQGLSVGGEQLWAIPPLTAEESLELLIARATSAGVGDVVADESVDLAAQLIERLDGLPLAIELAAARLRSMTLADLIARIDDRFALLSVGERTAEPRQQTLRNLVDWSHELLDDKEQRVFRRLGVFSGGATLDAIETVCADSVDAEFESRVSSQDLAIIVGQLVDKSLVIADRTTTGVRFRMLQTLADYAMEQLVRSGEAEWAGHRHTQYFAGVVATAERRLLGGEQRQCIEQLRTEWANIASAVDHALAVDDADIAVRLVAPLGWYFFMTDETAVGVEWLQAVLACTGPSDPRLRSLALASYAFLAATGPDPVSAAVVAEQAMSMLDRFEDPLTETFVTGLYVMCQLFLGRFDACREALPLTEAAAERCADRWTTAMVALVRAEVANLAANPSDVEREMRSAADGFAAVGDTFSYSICVAHQADLAEARGDYDRAVRMLEESFVAAERVGFSMRGLATRSRLGNLEILRGNLSLAESIHRQSLAESAGPAPQWEHAITLLGLANIARRRGEPEEAVRCAREAMALPRSGAVPMMRSSMHVALGYCADLAGDVETALQSQHEGLRVALEMGSARVIANAAEGLAGALALAGDAERAAALLGAADALRRRAGGPMPSAERFDVDRAECRARQELGDAAFELAFSVGAADPDEIVGTSLSQPVSG
jgi:predicted ATPase/DNA-binding SARP family transcriptional activator